MQRFTSCEVCDVVMFAARGGDVATTVARIYIQEHSTQL